MGGVFVRVSGQTASLISFEIERLCPANFYATKEGVNKKTDAPRARGLTEGQDSSHVHGSKRRAILQDSKSDKR